MYKLFSCLGHKHCLFAIPTTFSSSFVKRILYICHHKIVDILSFFRLNKAKKGTESFPSSLKTGKKSKIWRPNFAVVKWNLICFSFELKLSKLLVIKLFAFSLWKLTKSFDKLGRLKTNVMLFQVNIYATVAFRFEWFTRYRIYWIIDHANFITNSVSKW